MSWFVESSAVFVVSLVVLIVVVVVVVVVVDLMLPVDQFRISIDFLNYHVMKIYFFGNNSLNIPSAINSFGSNTMST